MNEDIDMSSTVGLPKWMRVLQGPTGNGPVSFDIAMLILRVGFGGLIAYHGWDKASGYAKLSTQFPDPLGIGVVNSLNGAIAAELVCGVLVLLGVFTRLATVPVIFTMAIAAFVIHAPHPLMVVGGDAKEPALLYLIAFLGIFLAGPGRCSVDAALQSVKAV